MGSCKKIQVCRWRLAVNSLWLWWYCILVLAAEGFLVHRAVKRCKEYNSLPWKEGDKPTGVFYAYIVLIVISVLCMPFLIFAAIFQVGNQANDGVRLGRDEETIGTPRSKKPAEEEEEEERGPETGGGVWGNFWKDVGPTSMGLHLLASFALLVPDTLLEAQEIKYGFLGPDAIGQSDLDIVFGRDVLHQDRLIFGYGIYNTSTTMASPIYREQTVHGISPEFGNYLVALVIYSLRYPSVFWYTNRIFSLVFSTMLMIAALCYAIGFCGVCILYKFQVNSDAFIDLEEFLLPGKATFILSAMAYAVVFFSFLSVFRYGYFHYLESWTLFAKKHLPHLGRRRQATGMCHGYMPHTMAALALVCFVGFKTPIVYDMVTLYKETQAPIILTCVLLDVGYMIVWVVSWFGLTLKQSWEFRVMPCARCFRSGASSVGARARQKAAGPRPKSAPEVMDGFLPPDIPGGTNLSFVDDGDVGALEDNCIAPTSALRKSGERRNGHQQRVTFGETAITEVTPPPPPRKKKPSHESAARPLSDSLLEEKTAARVAGGEAPENTLTRNYRSSLRDKCGQYYSPQPQQNFRPLPAAQSSPVLSGKRREKQARDSSAILLDAHALSDPESYSGHSSRAPEKPPRRSGQGRPPRAQKPKSAVIPRTYEPHLSQDDSFSTVSDAPPPRPLKQPRHVLRPPHLYDSFEVSSHTSSRTDSPRTLSEVALHRPLPPELSRTLIITKPDLHRRDSGMPSSNETSSNESTDVLCSQV